MNISLSGKGAKAKTVFASFCTIYRRVEVIKLPGRPNAEYSSMIISVGGAWLGDEEKQ